MKKPVPRGPNTWRLTWELDRDPRTGKRRQRTETFHGRKAEAEKRWRDVQTNEVERGLTVDPRRMTFGELAELWWSAALPLRDLAPKTLTSYRELLDKHVLPGLGAEQLRRITAADVQACLSEMQRHDRRGGELSPRRKQQALAVIRQVLTQGQKWGMLSQNVAVFADAPKQVRPDIAFWRSEEISAFLSTAAGERLYALYVLALATGMREGELFALPWANVDERAGVIRVERSLSRTKGSAVEKRPKSARSRRSIAVGPQVFAVLAQHRQRMDEERDLAKKWPRPDLVFVSVRGRPLHASNLSDDFDRVQARAGVQRITPHGLRHTHATQLLAAGVPVHVVSERLGHSSITVTLDDYAHVLPHQQTDAARIVDAALETLGDQIGTIGVGP